METTSIETVETTQVPNEFANAMIKAAGAAVVYVIVAEITAGLIRKGVKVYSNRRQAKKLSLITEEA